MDFMTPWTLALQAPLSMEFSRQQYWIGQPFFSTGIFMTQGSNPGLLHCRQILYHLSHQGSPPTQCFKPVKFLALKWKHLNFKIPARHHLLYVPQHLKLNMSKRGILHVLLHKHYLSNSLSLLMAPLFLLLFSLLLSWYHTYN